MPKIHLREWLLFMNLLVLFILLILVATGAFSHRYVMVNHCVGVSFVREVNKTTFLYMLQSQNVPSYVIPERFPLNFSNG